jgi:hypothetical protein
MSVPQKKYYFDEGREWVMRTSKNIFFTDEGFFLRGGYLKGGIKNKGGIRPLSEMCYGWSKSWNLQIWNA